MKQAQAFLPTFFGNFTIIAYSDDPNEAMPHLAMVHENFNPTEPVLMRIHSECLTGDVFASKKCDCGEQLSFALQQIAAEGGILLYLRQEGRGIGLINKLKAYALQEKGMNTVEANLHLGFQEDERQYNVAIEILQDLNIKKIRLLTNNPLKIKALEDIGFDITERVPIVIAPQEENIKYLEVKRLLMGHLY
jgi:3,4-dihydroxy 2-butanone 4-phosphate synthase/GTP cyclohydrolase II